MEMPMPAHLDPGLNCAIPLGSFASFGSETLAPPHHKTARPESPPTSHLTSMTPILCDQIAELESYLNIHAEKMSDLRRRLATPDGQMSGGANTVMNRDMPGGSRFLECHVQPAENICL